MRFLFRAAFWLLVMSTVVPSGTGAIASFDHAVDAVKSQAAQMGGKLGTWCASAPADCAALAKSSVALLRPSEPAIDRPSSAMVPAVPLPAVRPAALTRRS